MASTTTVATRLGRWLAEAPSTHSAIALERARQAVEDTVGCMVAGAGDEGAQAVRNWVGTQGDGRATVIGAGARGASPSWAALANATSAHVLDFDDNFAPGLTHASAVLVPALLALAQDRELTGAAFLDAYILGLDAHAVLGRGTGRTHYDVGWHNTSTVGCIGTAAACARLLGLDARRAAHALSLAVSMASGPKVQFGSPGKPFHAGLAAQHAVMAATLAEVGMTGRLEAIEGARGFLDLFAGDRTADWSALLSGLDCGCAIEEYGLAPKLYPCCGSAHRILDGVLALRAQHAVKVDDVARVDALVGYGNKRNLCYPAPTQEMEARFSLQYCVAVALTAGSLRLVDFTRDAVQRPHIRKLLELTHMEATPEGAEGSDPTRRLPHETKLTLRDGHVLETKVTHARGTLANPFSDADREAKYRDCCEGFLDADAYAASRESLATLHACENIRTLMRLVSFEAGGDAGERFARR